MAFKIPALKLPFGGAQSAAPARPPATGGFLSRPLPLIGHLPTGKQLQALGTALVALLAIDLAIVGIDYRAGTIGTIYIETVGRIQTLSQRLAKAAQQASQGNVEAFKQLKDSRAEFASRWRCSLSRKTAGPRGVA